MKRSYGDSELPGFFRDRRSGRYFKVPVNGSPLPRLFDGSHVEGASANSNTCRRKTAFEPTIPRFKNILNCLNCHQTGSIETHKYQQEVSTLRLQNLHLAHQFVYPSSNRDFTIRLFKGGIKHLYGQWVSQRNGIFFYALDDFADLSNTPVLDADCNEIENIAPQVAVADICEGFSHSLCLLYVGNDLTSGKGTSRIACRLVENDLNSPIMTRRFHMKSAVWCCSSNKFSDTFAVGIDNGIFLHNYHLHLNTKRVRGQVYGVQFKQTGEIIYAGVNHGKLITVDQRVYAPVCETKLNDYAITEVAVLGNENYVVCAGLENFLCQVDLRMQRKIFDYLGEVRNISKLPISFNESDNLLCSTGSDNVTRLWSLRGGAPLKSVPPPYPGEDCRSWLMDDASKIKLYLVSRNMVFRHEC